MNMIEQACPDSTMPPEGIGRGRKWIVLVEAYENIKFDIADKVVMTKT
jgi:hypothetical protein